MMLYTNRTFVATPEVHDLTEQGGFAEIVSDTPTIPRIFAPVGTTMYNETVIRMGVMGTYSMQKAIHHWFTTDHHIEVTEADWLEALPPNALAPVKLVTIIVFETSNRSYAAILRQSGSQITRDGEPHIPYTIELIEIQNPNVMFTDSMIVIGNEYATFNLSSELCKLPADITGQMLLHMFNLLHKRDLSKWEESELDPRGIIEIPVEQCSVAQIDGYAKFLNTPAPSDKKLFC
jgi:hypothetical protein